MLRSLSLCSGVGGLDQAVDLVTPTELVAYADPDPDASRVMSHNYPGVPNLGDITVYDFTQLLSLGINLLTAGYPCQPFSVAGRRKGTADVRHLYPFISDAIRILRPRFVFLENVAGHRSKGFGEVLWDLSESGYRVAWTSVRACDIGAPHRRERVFILAALPDSEGVGRGQGWSGSTWEQGGSHNALCGGESPTDPHRYGLETRGLPRGSSEEVSKSPVNHPAAAAHSQSVGRGSGCARSIGATQELRHPSDRGSDSVDWQQYTSAITRWEQLRGVEVPYPVALGPRGGASGVR